MSIVTKMPNLTYYKTLYHFKRLSSQDRNVVLYNYRNKTKISRHDMQDKSVYYMFNRPQFKNKLVQNYKKHHCTHMNIIKNDAYLYSLAVNGVLIATIVFSISNNMPAYKLMVGIFSLITIPILQNEYSNIVSKFGAISISYSLTLIFLMVADRIIANL